MGTVLLVRVTPCGLGVRRDSSLRAGHNLTQPRLTLRSLTANQDAQASNRFALLSE